MKALCVRQPYATLIARGLKPLEIRTWRTAHRGDLVIAASASYHETALAVMAKFGLRDEDCPRGVILCAVDLVDVRPTTRADREPSCWPACDAGFEAFVLERPRALKQRPVRGKLNVFEIPDEWVETL